MATQPTPHPTDRLPSALPVTEARIGFTQNTRFFVIAVSCTRNTSCVPG